MHDFRSIQLVLSPYELKALSDLIPCYRIAQTCKLVASSDRFHHITSGSHNDTTQGIAFFLRRSFDGEYWLFAHWK
jgi:hypothetical protein